MWKGDVEQSVVLTFRLYLVIKNVRHNRKKHTHSHMYVWHVTIFHFSP